MKSRCHLANTKRIPIGILCLLFIINALSANEIDQNDASSKQGLVAAYDFTSNSGNLVMDRSGAKPLVNLLINEPRNVLRANGSIKFIKGTTARSMTPPSKIINALKGSNTISVEVWFKPSNLKQDGPARLITISGGTSDRNFTIGQEGRSLQARVRTTSTSKNGLPALESNALLTTKVTHAVYSFNRGRAKLYINGRLVKEQKISGTFDNWDKNFKISIGNEVSNNRPWLGTIYYAAIYNRELNPNEITARYEAGKDKRGVPVIDKVAENSKLFERSIAPILANHCLECHDAANAKGDLDLSRKITAFADEGIIASGHSSKSLLWESVSKNEMPKKRPPLTDKEKKSLKDWLDGGANWTLKSIDPAVYVHEEKTQKHWIRRLTVEEYISTVNATMGVDISKEALEILPADLRADGFSNTAYNLNVDLEHVLAYSQLASKIITKIDIKKFAQRFSNNQSFTDKNMAQFLEKLGLWVLRGPLEKKEIVIYRGITTTAVASGANYQEAIALVLEAMLQSPRFIYRIEDNNSGEIVSDTELAVRLSYLIWGSSPDKALYDATLKGNFSDPETIRSHVDRMLGDPRAIDQSIRFLRQWLNLDSLANLRPDKKHFPEWEPQLAEDMDSETVAFFKEVIWEKKLPMSQLLNAQFTYLTPKLAKHYGIREKDSNELARYDLSEVPSRGGLLTQGSTLTIGGDEASMVTRGLFVLHDLLRGVVKDPPPCVDTTPVPIKPGLSQRLIAEKRISNKNCGGCHSRFEPLAFGLERFDGLGTYMKNDSLGNLLREDGKILIPGEATPLSYESSAKLMDLLSQSDRVSHSLTWKITQFAMGRPLGAKDVSKVDKIHQRAKNNGSTYPSIIHAIATSDLIHSKEIQENK